MTILWVRKVKSLKHILNILEYQGVSLGIISLIQDIYTQNYARVKIGGKLEGKIPVNQGLRLGDSLSPLLFNIVINEIIKDLRDLQGDPLWDENVNIVCYADDATLIVDKEDDLQRLLTRLSQSCTKFDLKISSKKTKSLIISKDPLHCKLQVDYRTSDMF
jgi:hypothetical protein